MNKYLLKFYIKSGIIIGLILVFAVVATRLIYDKFSTEHDSVDPSKNFEVVFHEKSKDKISLTKVTPVSDAVGLSSNAYTISVKNNNGKTYKYSISIVDDADEYVKDGCASQKIPIESIKIGYHRNTAKNDILLLSELDDNILITDDVSPGEKKDYTIRLWIDNDTNLNLDKNGHYHGLIVVKEIE